MDIVLTPLHSEYGSIYAHINEIGTDLVVQWPEFFSLITAPPNHCRFHWYGYQSNRILNAEVLGLIWRPSGLTIVAQCLTGAFSISEQYFNGFAESSYSDVCDMQVTTSYLVFPFNLKSTQLEPYLIMARKGKPLSDDTRIAIIRMFYSGYNKKDIMKALDIGEMSFWRTLKQWRTNCHFRKQLTRETQGRPRKMGIIESSVCPNCTYCKC